jgi:hypothetical protein
VTTPTESIVTLDPRDESNPGPAMLAPRDTTLDGKVVGLFSNNKPHSVELLRMIADVMKERYTIKGVVEHNKGGHQWTANPEDLKDMSSRCDVAIHATAE